MMDAIELKEFFRAKYQECLLNQEELVDLLFLAVEIGEQDLNKIGLAARSLAAELGDGVRLEANMFGLMLWINPTKACP
jgi:hypothetical protein